MHLIAALASGVNGAESGTAYLYQRGTSTLLASYYTDFEATASVTQTSAGIALDAHGGALVYVDTLCKVVVKSSTGSTIRTFVAGAKDSAVEVISDSFTGVDYADASTGVNKPTTLQSVLNRWNDSAGTSNFQVLVSGVATDLQSAVQGVAGFFYNVKTDAYGAAGDGTTDDTVSIQAAIDDADSGGGGTVIFPPGTYRITDPLEVPRRVSLLGAGPNSSIISMDSATNEYAVNFPGQAASKYRFQSMAGLRVESAQANTSPAVRVVDAFLLIDNCVLLGAAAGFSDEVLAAAGSPTAYHVVLHACTVSWVGTGDAISMDGASSFGHLDIVNSRISSLGTSVTGFAALIAGTADTVMKLSNVEIDVSSATVACTTRGLFSSTSYLVASNVWCEAPSSGSAAVYDLGVATTTFLRESGTVVKGAGVQLYSVPSDSVADQVFSQSRSANWRDTSTTAGTVSVDSTNYGSELIQKTSGATLTINDAGNCPVGDRYVISVWNDGTGGNVAITWGTNFKGTGDNVGNNTVRTYQFVSRVGPSGTVHLYEIGTPRDETE